MNRLSMTTLGTPKPSQSVINDVFRDQGYTDKTIARFILSTPSTVSKPTASQITDIFERAAQEEDAEFVAMLLTSPVHVPKPSRRVVSDVFCRSHDGSSNLRSFLLSIPNITYFLTPDAIRNVLREALMNQEFALIQQLIHADKGCLNAWKYELPKLMEETAYCGERSSTAAFVASLLNEKMDALALLQLDA
jgi:hypothetical protein